jgi:hypothetical protein
MKLDVSPNFEFSHLCVKTKKRSWLGGRLSITDKRLGFVASYRQRYRLGSQADRMFHCLFDCRPSRLLRLPVGSYSRLPGRLLRSYSVPSLVVQLEILPKRSPQPSMQSLLRLLTYCGSFRLTLLLSIFEVYFKLFTHVTSNVCEEQGKKIEHGMRPEVHLLQVIALILVVWTADRTPIK